jgi:hypothetical protein
MDKTPDFYLSSAGEYEPLASPRACWQRARLRDKARDDYMLIDIEPPLEDQRFGPKLSEIGQLIISSRHVGQTLYPVSEWPSFVYVARILDNGVLESRGFSRDQVEVIAWGVLFPRREDAADHARKFQR